MSRLFVEFLEPRRLFAGVTLMATGRLGGQNGWIASMSADITQKLGGALKVPECTLTIDQEAPNSGVLEGTISHVDGTAFARQGSGQIIVMIDYYNISSNADFSLDYIGKVAANILKKKSVDGIRLAELPIHAIGFSRGAGLI